MGILDKISEIEKEIARTQKNKGKLWSKSLNLIYNEVILYYDRSKVSEAAFILFIF